MPRDRFDRLFGGIPALDFREIGDSHCRAHVTPRDASDRRRLRDFPHRSILDARQIADFHLRCRADEALDVIRKVLDELQVVAENVKRGEILSPGGLQIREQL